MVKQRKKNLKKVIKRLFTKTIRRPGFPKAYSVFGVITLLLTIIFWALPTALVHQHNADQLVDPYLFENVGTFQAAIFPGQHSFLIKWPLFWLVSLCGSSPTAFVLFTLAVTLLTVGLLVYILYRIERRPVVFGALCLALASALLLIPAESYPGALLPMNMAMLATRNLEYIVYIASIILLIRAPRLISWKMGLAVLTLGSLIASDKLFLTLSLGGSFVALIAYLLFKQRQLVQLALRWLIVSVLASGLAMSIIWLISITDITTISDSAGAGPYALVNNFKDLALGIIYGILGIFTNLGANPAFDATIAKNIPAQALQRLLSPAGPTYLINISLAFTAIVISYKLWWTSLRTKLKKTKRAPKPLQTSIGLSLIMIWTSLAAFGVFIASNHYYAVDARYLTIFLFTVFIVIAIYMRRIRLRRARVVIAGLIIVCGIALGLHSSWQTSANSAAVLSTNQQRNHLIIDALAQNPVKTLVGDYWRVLPIKQAMRHSQNVLPLADCTTPRDVLTSSAWKRDLSRESFAYLLPLKPSTTGYPGCSIEQIIGLYGRPSASHVIAGTASEPEEVLLFYSYGINDTMRHSRPTASILPISTNQIRNTRCNNSTIMNIVAHQDDDILFMNPDLIHSLQAGDCIRSVYLTAGDSGGGRLYWLGREEGSKAAYAQMLGVKNPIWTTRTVSLSKTAYVTLATLKNSPNVSLIFFHLPDGNINGHGFEATNFESLEKLETGGISTIHSVDGQSMYTPDQLINALVKLIDTYKPDEIRTQATHNLSEQFADHSDHLAAGNFAKRTQQQYAQQEDALELTFYVGYPIRDQPENVDPADVTATENTFFTYAKHDSGACNSIDTCSTMSYIYYLNRQYTTE
ncbi:MAG TPA: PIG-L family deacetylase [Candidatus Saccharimonadales bacterium]